MTFCLLVLFVLCIPHLRANPNGRFALLLRRGIPPALLVVFALCLYFQLRHNRIPELLEDLRPYYGLALICNLVTLNWLFAPGNASPWFIAPWKQGSSKAPWLLLNLLIAVFVLRLLWASVLATVVAGYLITKFKGAARMRSHFAAPRSIPASTR